ncbi:MAG TPA: AMP-binding protein [Steroidobacteraceae bacterium]|nr:AMP-binding protein [Steroidobacteraceae bacterium]
MLRFQAPSPLVPDLIAQNGRWLGEQPAFVDGEVTLTWGEFAAGTARVAHALAALGVAPRERVALLMDTRFETLLALFGILRAGAVAVPLNTFITNAAVAGMCADASCSVVFASGPHCVRIDELRRAGALRARLYVGCEPPRQGWLEFHGLCAAQQATDPQVAIAPDDECNLIYSSGTTAHPKGIVHTHACRMHWAYDVALALRYRSGCRNLISLGLFSNISWVTLLTTILVGGTSVLLRAFTAPDALALIERERITHGAFVPVQLQRLLEYPERGSFDTVSLETLMCCGASLPAAVKRAFASEFHCDLIELYGLTEGLFTILQPEDFERKLRSVGKPVLGTDIRILGEDDRELAAGETGEIVGRGRLVMAGYHEQEQANREASWTDATGRQWLRTGDLGRLDAEGFLYIVDRKKDMILSGGQNIYPADIEAVMREHPAVADIAVVGVPSERWGETPLAVVVARPGSSVDATALMEWTNARVGKQQRIGALVWRDSLPRNPNGKVLKRELRRDYASLGAQLGTPS